MRGAVETASPAQALEFLFALFPAFEKEWQTDEVESEPLNDELTYHRIMFEFIQFFGGKHATFTEDQIKRFGAWVNDSILQEGPLENAISTCFLEHMRQVKINRVLAPYLSKAAKEKSHA